jgi:hypothetical protein
MKLMLRSTLVLLAGLLATGCRQLPPRASVEDTGHDLIGAWRAKLQFRSGAFAAVKDLEFMYAFNTGGTMTESSNYDAAPPVPPAYGIWRRIGRNQFEAKYEFYVTRAPASLAEVTKGGGWLPTGRGVFTETITLSDGGDSWTSRIRYEAVDPTGRPVEGGGEADGRGVRLTF